MSSSSSLITQENPPTYPKASFVQQMTADDTEFQETVSTVFGGASTFVPGLGLTTQILYPAVSAMFMSQLTLVQNGNTEINGLFFVNANQGRSKLDIKPEVVFTQMELLGAKAFNVRQFRILYPSPAGHIFGYPTMNYVELQRRPKEEVLDVVQSIELDFDMHNAGLPDSYLLNAEQRGLIALIYAGRASEVEDLGSSLSDEREFSRLLETKMGSTNWFRLLGRTQANLLEHDLKIPDVLLVHQVLIGLSALLKDRKIKHDGVPRSFFQKLIENSIK